MPTIKKIKPLADKKELELVKQKTLELLELMLIQTTKLEIKKDKDGIIHINMDAEKNALLIGFKGETLSSLQLVLNLIIYKTLGYWVRLVVNVADWRERKEESLQQMANGFAQKVKFSQKEVVLPYLNSAERRIVHMTLVDNPDVVTESIGEGSERKLVIKPKQQLKK